MAVEDSVYREAIAFAAPDRGVLLTVPGRQAAALLMFVHGYTGDYYATWGRTPILTVDDSDFLSVDFCYIGFPALLNSCSVLGMHVASVIDKACKGLPPFRTPYERILVVTHSLGGLGLRAALLDFATRSSSHFENVKECLLLAPPLFGFHASRVSFLSLALETLSLLTPVVRDLRHDSQEVQILREKYDSTVHSLPQDKRPTSHLRWGQQDLVVVGPPANYTPSPPDTQTSWPYGHATIVKPKDRSHHFYQAVRVLALASGTLP